MLLLEWKALRVGDRVAVHDDAAVDLTMHEGVVRLIRTRTHDSPDLGIRIDDAQMVWPRRQAVHQLPDDRRFSCWRCAATTLSHEPGAVVAA